MKTSMGWMQGLLRVLQTTAEDTSAINLQFLTSHEVSLMTEQVAIIH